MDKIENKRYDFHNYGLIKFPMKYIEFVDYVKKIGLSLHKILKNSEKNRFEVYFNKSSDPELFMNFLFPIVKKSTSNNICGEGKMNWKYSMKVVGNGKPLNYELRPLTYVYIVKIPEDDFIKIHTLIKNDDELFVEQTKIYGSHFENIDDLSTDSKKYKKARQLYKTMKLYNYRCDRVQATNLFLSVIFETMEDMDNFSRIILYITDDEKLKMQIIGGEDDWSSQIFFANNLFGNNDTIKLKKYAYPLIDINISYKYIDEIISYMKIDQSLYESGAYKYLP